MHATGTDDGHTQKNTEAFMGTHAHIKTKQNRKPTNLKTPGIKKCSHTDNIHPSDPAGKKG